MCRHRNFSRFAAALILVVILGQSGEAQIITNATNSIVFGNYNGLPAQLQSFWNISSNAIGLVNYAPTGNGAIGFGVYAADSTVKASYSEWAIAGVNTWTGTSAANTKTQIGVSGEGSSTGSATILALYGYDGAAIMYAGAGSISIGIGYHNQSANHSANTFSGDYDFYAQESMNDGGGGIGTHYGYYAENFTVSATNWAFYSAGTTQSHFGGMIDSGPIAFASLGTPSNGKIVYCNDCTIANPCAGSGTGAFAKRLNATWVCN